MAVHATDLSRLMNAWKRRSQGKFMAFFLGFQFKGFKKIVSLEYDGGASLCINCMVGGHNIWSRHDNY